MSENIQSISQGTYTIGNTNELTFSAGPGIKVDSPSEGVVRIGNDETVLWSGIQSGAYTFQLSESLNNFEKFRIAIGFEQGIIEYKDIAIPSGTLTALGVSISRANSAAFWSFYYPLTFNANKTTMSIEAGKGLKCNGSSIEQYYASNTQCVVYGIWGLNRISGSNA